MGTTTLAQTSPLNYPGKSGNSEEQDEPPNKRGAEAEAGPAFTVSDDASSPMG